MEDLGRIGVFLECDHLEVDLIFEESQEAKGENDATPRGGWPTRQIGSTYW